MDCCLTFASAGFHYSGCWNHPDYVEPLAPWERELLGQTLRSDVEFFLKDGSSFTIQDIEIDTIGDNGENKGITAVEAARSDNTFHVPNVLYWTIHHVYS